jgi:predicted nucleic acid-binding protein
MAVIYDASDIESGELMGCTFCECGWTSDAKLSEKAMEEEQSKHILSVTKGQA